MCLVSFVFLVLLVGVDVVVGGVAVVCVVLLRVVVGGVVGVVVFVCVRVLFSVLLGRWWCCIALRCCHWW